MKTAISLPDDLFDAAESLAKKQGLSRSKLFATALAEYVAKNQGRRVSERLDAVYSTESNDEPFLREAARRTLKRSEW